MDSRIIELKGFDLFDTPLLFLNLKAVRHLNFYKPETGQPAAYASVQTQDLQNTKQECQLLECHGQ
jgi:hypothetical protein